MAKHTNEQNNSVIMSVMASQIISVSIGYPTVCSGADQGRYQISASLAFVRGIPPYKGFVTRKLFPFDDVIICIYIYGISCTFIAATPIQLLYCTDGVLHSFFIIYRIMKAANHDEYVAAPYAETHWSAIPFYLRHTAIRSLMLKSHWNYFQPNDQFIYSEQRSSNKQHAFRKNKHNL